jgi:hypothetical protein
MSAVFLTTPATEPEIFMGASSINIVEFEFLKKCPSDTGEYESPHPLANQNPLRGWLGRKRITARRLHRIGPAGRAAVMPICAACASLANERVRRDQVHGSRRSKDWPGRHRRWVERDMKDASQGPT